MASKKRNLRMKYMTFNRSCSYAGIANMVEKYGHHYEDRDIIKILGIPYMFLYKENSYRAGAMIQTLFNYFLNPLGLNFIEKFYTSEEALAEFDKNESYFMFAPKIRADGSGHAVIFLHKQNDKYHFLNPKHKGSSDPDYYTFSKCELMEKMYDRFLMGQMGHLEEANTKKTIPRESLLSSVKNLENYQDELMEFCQKEQDVGSLNDAKDVLFAPLLLDVLAMMELIDEHELAEGLKAVRRTYLDAMKENKTLILADHIDLDYLIKLISKYKAVISTYVSSVC
jgi:hypothetical protein